MRRSWEGEARGYKRIPTTGMTMRCGKYSQGSVSVTARRVADQLMLKNE